MRSKVADKIRAKTPEDIRIFVRLYGDILVKVNQIMNEKGYTQKDLADKLGKSPSEIHKWLSGEHNFTLKSLAKLQAELGETFLHVAILRNAEFIPTNVHIELSKKTKIVRMQSSVPLNTGSSDWESGKVISNKEYISNAG